MGSGVGSSVGSTIGTSVGSSVGTTTDDDSERAKRVRQALANLPSDGTMSDSAAKRTKLDQ